MNNSNSIPSNFSSGDVIGKAPDVAWNSNWPTGKSFYSSPGGLLENPAGLHGNRAWTIEQGYTWTGGTPANKDTWTEIWGDGADAAAKDGAAIVILVTIDFFNKKIFINLR